MQTVFDVISSKMGLTNAFCALYLICDQSVLIDDAVISYDEDEDSENDFMDNADGVKIKNYEDYIKYLSDDFVIDGIVNTHITGDKLTSYCWLEQYIPTPTRSSPAASP